MNKMVVGCATKMEWQAAGQLALQSQEKCLKQIRSYFATLPPYEDFYSFNVYYAELRTEFRRRVFVNYYTGYPATSGLCSAPSLREKAFDIPASLPW